MKSILFIISLLFTSVSFSQSVKKVKITELDTYIKASDHPLVVSMWATWCAPCVEELPWIEAAVKKYAAHKVEFVLISLDLGKDYPRKVTDFVQQKKIAATYFWLDETDADYFCPFIDAKWSGGIPATLFINNKTNYRKFFERQLTDRQVEPEVKLLVAGE